MDRWVAKHEMRWLEGLPVLASLRQHSHQWKIYECGAVGVPAGAGALIAAV